MAIATGIAVLDPVADSALIVRSHSCGGAMIDQNSSESGHQWLGGHPVRRIAVAGRAVEVEESGVSMTYQAALPRCAPGGIDAADTVKTGAVTQGAGVIHVPGQIVKDIVGRAGPGFRMGVEGGMTGFAAGGKVTEGNIKARIGAGAGGARRGMATLASGQVLLGIPAMRCCC